ncbi:MAG: hypothetical protein CL679_08525 [Bermanella sp.]|nr:hypothetical protein [Bermanella sp.]|tara:strand:+ start:145 stop:648 length:504 start_codon:yes stop_codon:yes gene_type:complete
MLMVIKMSLILGTLLGITHQWSAILENGSLNWLAWLISYVLCFVVFYFWDKHNKKHIDTEPVDAPLGSVSAAQLDALYKQSIIVERNAHKANAVFTQQLNYVRKLLHKTQSLAPGDDFEQVHANLVQELTVLEHHIERLLEEMNKNVKLGEKLQQSVANIDPEIGVF